VPLKKITQTYVSTVKYIFKYQKTTVSIATLKQQYQQQVLHSRSNIHSTPQPFRLSVWWLWLWCD